jgi:hypothetical protein
MPDPPISITTDGFANADAACAMLVSGVNTTSAAATSANASRKPGTTARAPLARAIRSASATSAGGAITRTVQ